MPITTNREKIERIKEGVKRGVVKALAKHKRDGNSIVVFHNGKIEQIQPENIQVSKS
ncbi:MAG: hypothetical protein JNL74_02535 [Fibrobacteres bacterium]|nr:hypothetical protein [Fibrobacterota bacterium]